MAWDDLQRGVLSSKGATAMTYEAFRDTSYFMGFFRHNADVDLSFEYQMPHSWDPRTVVRPHLHVMPMANGSGNVRISGIYYWSLNSVAVPAAASWSSFTVDTAFVAADQYQHKLIAIGELSPPSGAQESDVLLLFVQRPAASDAADTYQTNKDHGTATANLGLLSADLHFQPIKRGTVTELGPV